MTALRLADEAVELARAGWPVFPVAPRGKLPLIPSAHPDGDPLRGVCRGECGKLGHGYHDATADPAIVAAWWGRRPTANIGFNLEAAGLWALDLDRPREGRPADGVAALEALAAKHGPLPLTPAARTGGGGLHLIFTAKPDLDYTSPAPSVDTKHHGYIVVSPSVHPSGRRYEWEPGRSILEIDPAEPPLWLEMMVTSPAPERPAGGPRRSAGPAVLEVRIGGFRFRAGTDRGPCPVCESPDGFHGLPGGRWVCHSSRHDATRVGRRGRECWTGSGADLLAYFIEEAAR